MNKNALLVGIDEARRSEIIGSMWIAGVAISENEIQKLASRGLKDSKQLTYNEIGELYKKIAENGILTWQKISPTMIDAENINNLLSQAIAKILNELCVHKPVSVTVDNCEHSVDAFFDRLSKYYSKASWKVKDFSWTVEHKADENHLVVAAASIVAKWKSIQEIEELKNKYGDFGGGGCCINGDAKFKEWLQQFTFETLPKCVRRKWRNVKKFYGIEEEK